MESLIKTAQFLSDKRNSYFAWSKNDCTTMVLELHDKLYGTDTLAILYGKYSNQRQAYRLAKTVEVKELLQDIGYEQRKTPKSGDVVLIKHKHGYYSHIYFDGNLFSMDEQQHATAIAWKAVKDHNPIIMRYSK